MIKHSLSIRGHRTSVSLEQPFWEVLQQIASRRGISVSALITEIDAGRTMSGQGGAMNGLSSAIRVFILNDTLHVSPLKEACHGLKPSLDYLHGRTVSASRSGHRQW